MASKVGTLIKEARTQAGLTQEALAKKIKGLSANDISLVERGEKSLTQAVLKEIAKVTGVTQKSLIDAAKAEASKKDSSSSSKKSSASSSGKSSSSSSKKNSSSSSKKSSSSSSKKSDSSASGKSGTSSDSFRVSSEEKKIIKAYRDADDKIKSAVKLMLLGTEGLSTESAGSGLSAGTDPSGMVDLLGTLMGSVKQFLG